MRLLVLSLVIPAAAACSGAGGDSATADANEALACLNTGRGDTYVAGLERTGAAGQLDFRLMSADPAPPGFNNNTWVVQINAMSGGAAGAAASDATIRVTPFMPDHQHGTQIRAVAEAMSTAGQYKLSPINMWMPGYWEITIDAQTATAHDSVLYKFCIQP